MWPVCVQAASEPFWERGRGPEGEFRMLTNVPALLGGSPPGGHSGLREAEPHPLGTGQLTQTARPFMGLGPGSEGVGRRLLLAAPSNLHFSLCWEGGGVGGAGELSLTPWA